jgi:hypothetical protein
MRFPIEAIVALIAAAPAAASNADSRNHIVVSREVVLEPGNATIDPTAIVKTSDRAYIITGRDFDQPWALKVDGQGTVIWTHRYGEKGKLGYDSRYSGAVALQDGSVLLCGTVDLVPPTIHRPPQIFGMITKVDRRGSVISNMRLTAGEKDQPDHTDIIDRCVRTRSGAIATGYAINNPGLDAVEFYWLIGVEDGGSVQWRRTIPVQPAEPGEAASTTGIRDLLPMLNGDLVLITYQNLALKVTATGTLKNSGRMEVPIRSVSAVEGASFPLRSMPELGTARITAFDQNLDSAGTALRSHSDGLMRSAIFELSDKALAVFGSGTNAIGTASAAVGWVSPTGDESESLVLQPPPAISIKVAAVVPTGVPGEFATVRRNVSLTDDKADSRSGVILSFVQFH